MEICSCRRCRVIVLMPAKEVHRNIVGNIDMIEIEGIKSIASQYDFETDMIKYMFEPPYHPEFVVPEGYNIIHLDIETLKIILKGINNEKEIL